jgi:hypothetical protein
MPYKKGDTPEQLGGKNIPQKFVNQFIEVFNKVLKDTGEENSAFRQAYSVMAKALHKSGYRKKRDGTWMKTSVKEELDQQFESFRTQPLELSGVDREVALRDGLDVPGIALIDNELSQMGTGWERYYSKEANNQILKRSLEFMELGHKITVYPTHAAALGDWYGPEGSPDARVTNLYREGDKIMYTMHISPTSEGRDMITRLLDGLIEETSVRIYEVKSEGRMLPKNAEGKEESITEILDGVIKGIDFCDEAGVTGAGVFRKESVEFKENEMEYSDITLEGLTENCPDLVNALVSSKLGAISALIEGVKSERDEAKAALAAVDTELPAKYEAEQAKVTEFEAKIAKMSRVIERTPIAKKLLDQTSGLSAEEFESKFAEILNTAVESMVAESPSGDSADGKVKRGGLDVGDENYERDATAEEKKLEDAEGKLDGLFENAIAIAL